MQVCNPHPQASLTVCRPKHDCTVGLSGLFAGANADLAIYQIERGPGPKPCCDEPRSAASLYDPRPARESFESADETIQLVWSGRAIAQSGGKAQLKEQDWGDIETTQIDATIPKTNIEICTGWYVYVRRFGDLEGGKITAIDRHSWSVIKLTIDTAKVVPFPPGLVGVGEWPRKIQN